MSSLEGFDASQVEPNDGYDVLPAGEYRVCIVSAPLKPTKSGTGELINLELQVLDGQYQNRKIFDRINWKNQNPKAQEIGRARLSSICRAVGVLTPKDTSELLNRPLRCKVKIKRSEQYGDQNEVVKYLSDKAGPSQPPASGGGESASAWAQTMGG